MYGIPGDSLNGFTDALRRDGGIAWEHVRHEEAAAFAAAAEAALTGELAVCAASCGPGNLHLINGLYDANAAGCRYSRSPRRSRGRRSAANTSRRRIPGAVPRVQRLLRTGQHAGADPRVLEIAMRTALARGGVGVVVIPGEVFFADAPRGAKVCRYGRRCR